MRTEAIDATNNMAVTNHEGMIPILASGASDSTAANSSVEPNQLMLAYCNHFFAGFFWGSRPYPLSDVCLACFPRGANFEILIRNIS